MTKPIVIFPDSGYTKKNAENRVRISPSTSVKGITI